MVRPVGVKNKSPKHSQAEADRERSAVLQMTKRILDHWEQNKAKDLDHYNSQCGPVSVTYTTRTKITISPIKKLDGEG